MLQGNLFVASFSDFCNFPPIVAGRNSLYIHSTLGFIRFAQEAQTQNNTVNEPTPASKSNSKKRIENRVHDIVNEIVNSFS